MTDYNTLIAQLQEMAADQLGQNLRYGCYSCGHEHNCRTEGCAILRDAIATMEQLYKDCKGNCSCCTYVASPTDKPPCDNCFSIRHQGDIVGHSWQWRGVQKEGKDNG